MAVPVHGAPVFEASHIEHRFIFHFKNGDDLLICTVSASAISIAKEGFPIYAYCAGFGST